METLGTFQPSADSQFRMVDIGAKADTQRRAIASGRFFAKPETISRIRERSLPKGDVLALAEVAGIQGAKQTSQLLPLCHPLSLTSVRVWTQALGDRIEVFCEAKTTGKTGVEMEALCGVNAALLCIYDLTKGIDPVLSLGDVRLELKEGGKSGTWRHPEGTGPTPTQQTLLPLLDVTAAVITLSDRCYQKKADDLSGPLAADWLKSQGATLQSTSILPDDAVALQTELKNHIDRAQARVVITSGGTGVSRRDVTPEAVSALSKEMGGKEITGVGELLRSSGAGFTKKSWLSRSCAFLIRGTLVICLPGSPKAVQQALGAVGDLIPHCLHVAEGGGHVPS